MKADALFAGLDTVAGIALVVTSFLGSFVTAALGIGGGAFLLIVMASIVPPAALIPVHGVVQLGSNLSRAVLFFRHTVWVPVATFAIGSVIGAGLGGSVVVTLPPAFVQIGVGGFVIWTIFARAPRWMARWPFLTGAISSFLTMFFGATGVFVATVSKALDLSRQAHVGTHATLMTLQHLLKVVIFGLLGFAFGPWLPLIAMMLGAGVLGTLAGKAVLVRLSDQGFRRALDFILILLSVQLILRGVFDLATG